MITWGMPRRRAGLAAVAVVTALLSGCTAKPAAKAPSPEIAFPLAFTGDDGNVWVLDHLGGTPRYVTQGDSPQWTPDHRMLVVSRPDLNLNPPSAELWLVSAASGKDIGQITHIYPEQARFFAVGGGRTPFVVYSTDTAVWRVNLDGSGTRRVVPVAADSLAVSRDGTKLVYVPDAADGGLTALVEVGADGTARRAVFTGTRNNCGGGSPSWSPDGKWIAFDLCTGGQASYKVLTRIWLIRPDGTGLHELVSADSPVWSPDGKWIVYRAVSPDAASGQTGLFMIRPDGTGRRQVTAYGEPAGTKGASDPSW